MSGRLPHLVLATFICLSVGGCFDGELYVVSESNNQMMIIDRIERIGPESNARITIISRKPHSTEVNDWLIRRLSFDTKFRCAEGTLQYGASVVQLETGSTMSLPASGTAWEHPSPETEKAKAVKVVCELNQADLKLEARTLDQIEREYRNRD